MNFQSVFVFGFSDVLILVKMTFIGKSGGFASGLLLFGFFFAVVFYLIDYIYLTSFVMST